MKILSTIALIVLLPFFGEAQIKQKSGFRFSPAFELMRSTHSNLFYSPSFKANYLFENGWEPGIGIEYSSTLKHGDNGFVLTKVHLLPIYGNLKYNFLGDSKFRGYVETSIGHSFNRYNRASDREPAKQVRIRETGLYLYTGVGTKYAISKHVDIFLAAGFKGYKFTTNDLDVNPHGLSFTLGVTLF